MVITISTRGIIFLSSVLYRKYYGIICFKFRHSEELHFSWAVIEVWLYAILWESTFLNSVVEIATI